MSICQHIENAPHTDYVCTLPAAHAGDHDLIDAMGICGEHDDCRATSETSAHFGACDWSAYRSERENAIEHAPRCPARQPATA
jgi:hypothetical protein